MQLNNRVKNILLVESSMDGVPGGSYYSARLLLKGLIAKGFNVYIQFYIKNPIMSLFTKENVIVLHPIYRKKKKINFENYGIDKFSTIKNYFLVKSLKIFLKYVTTVKFIAYELFQICYLIKVIKKHNINAVHLNNGITPNRDGIIAAKLCKVKCIVHERKIRKYDRTDIFLSNFINVVVPISNHVYDNCDKYSIRCKKIRRIYNPFIKKNFNQEKVKEIKDSYKNLIVLSAIGNIIPWKGQLTFLQAINIIFHHYNFHNFKALIIGGVMNLDYYQELKEFCKENKIEHLVDFIDFVTDIENYMQASDIIVHTSNKPEPFGRVIVEALALGKHVIASDQGGPKEIIESGKNGLLFDSEDPKELADKIIHILGGNLKIDSDTVAKNILKRFSLDRHVNEIIRFCYK